MLLINKEELLQKFVEHAYKVTYDGTSTEYGMTLTGIRQVIEELDESDMKQLVWERDMAMRQLQDLGYGFCEEPRKGDTISRQAVLKIFNDMLDDYPISNFVEGFNRALLMAEKAVENLPSIGREDGGNGDG